MVVDTYYAIPPFYELKQNELEHVRCYRDYYDAYVRNMDKIASIGCDCRFVVEGKLKLYLSAIYNAAIACAVCNAELDKPGGPHGH